MRSPSAQSEYRQSNNKVGQELRNTRNVFFQSFMSGLTSYHDTNYSLWIATKKFRCAPIPRLSPILVNNTWIRDDEEKVELYADHF